MWNANSLIQGLNSGAMSISYDYNHYTNYASNIICMGWLQIY